MKDDNKLMELVEKHLSSGLEDLWDALIPEERMRVFNRFIIEYVGVTYGT